MTFTVAIAGRPNVGKSTLFNRLIGKKMAIVSDEPGVTRDWREGEGSLLDLKFRALDTAGLEDVRTKGSISSRMVIQTKRALEQTDVIVLVVDGRAGLLQDDKFIAREIRKTGKPIILVANKCEGTYLPENFDEAAELGFGDPIAISATHGDGLADLYQALSKYIGPTPIEEPKPRKEKQVVEAVEGGQSLGDAALTDDELEEEKHLLVAVVGRPNAGKSTLINRLIGEERMMTGPEPGLTRDAIQISWVYKGRPVRLVDTAGLRKRARVSEKLEKMSGHETLRAIRLAHVVVLMVDAASPLDKQDLIIGNHVVEEGRCLVVAVNKWDAVKDKKATLRLVREKVEDSLAQVSGLPIVTISALEDQGLGDLMDAVLGIYQTWNKRISTGQLNRWLEKMEFDHPPPITQGRRIKLRYMTQVKSRPPTFSLWVNKPVDLPESYKRFLTHGLRDVFELAGVPIRWQVKKSSNPYLEDDGKPRANAPKGYKPRRRKSKGVKKHHMLRKKDKRVRQKKERK